MWATLASRTTQTCPHTTPESPCASKSWWFEFHFDATFDGRRKESEPNAVLSKIFSDNSGAGQKFSEAEIDIASALITDLAVVVGELLPEKKTPGPAVIKGKASIGNIATQNVYTMVEGTRVVVRKVLGGRTNLYALVNKTNDNSPPWIPPRTSSNG